MDISPEFDGYSRVVIWLDAKDDDGNELYYEAGTSTGRTLEMTCPWGTQQMANDVLERISPSQGRAFQYQPYTATRAILDPAAEIGDGVTLKGTYSGIFAQVESFGSRHLSDISAPTEEEIDHEYPFESATSRKTDRKFAQEHAERRAEFKILTTQIDARVVKEYDSETEAFGWRLTENQFLVYGGTDVSNPVLRVTRDGLTVRGSGTFTGTVTANDGKIGNFIIKNGTLQYGKTSMTDGNNGVYIGSNGIALGKNSAFRVDSGGNLYATSGTFTGTVHAGSIQYGGNAGYMSGNGLQSGSVGGSAGNGRLSGSSVGNSNMANATLSKDKLNAALQNQIEKIDALLAGNIRVSWLNATAVATNSLYVNGTHYSYGQFYDMNGMRRTALMAN